MGKRLIFIFAFLVVLAFLGCFILHGGLDFSKSSSYSSNQQCTIETWNWVHTESISSSYVKTFSKWLWKKLELTAENIHNNTEVSILAAYVYPETIAISLITQHMLNQKMYCRYYDCERNEIPGSAWRGVVFPESVIECPRRIGAVYVSVSREMEEVAPTPVRLKFRAYKEPVHQLSVCMAPTYGNGSHWLPIVDFVEHNKLEGATFFFFYAGQIRKYDEKILNEYVRTGDMELVKLQDKYQRVFISWQFLEVQDCHLRSKYFSKWTAVIDLDERMTTFGQRMIDLLRSIQDPSIGVLDVPHVHVIQNDDFPAKFENRTQLEKELIFKKYNKTTSNQITGSKFIIRPDKIGVMLIHEIVGMWPGIKLQKLDKAQAVLRHYRSTKNRMYQPNWNEIPDKFGVMPIFKSVPLPEQFSKDLEEAVVQRVLRVYDSVPVNCSSIPKQLANSLKYPDPCKEPWVAF
ncbi:Glycosyltransferase family 92 protein [Caenorhabditis elegans]|uniref:Glycosyltransferase family 92 protein n=1 Tax=Caenorhabditis elegans TaxID=6239 RepID=O45703_CAEEL|nr:Glycosyltransferase family 92 protein [Caenorhabditis elegans]CAB05267.2 Glycosyltransferase family 92 protein [Caenorhabditis elegans]|eukprot:NP_502716.2 Uncharacterized protein CELE_R05A10.6 [Caenorhabditis elegans]